MGRAAFHNGRRILTRIGSKNGLYLEDYAYLVEGLLHLYQTSFEPRWFVAAHEPAETTVTRFQAPEGVQLARTGQLPSKAEGLAGFYDTSDDHETLITRPRDLQDNATRSGNAMAVTSLLKLAGLSNDLRYVNAAHQALAQMQPMIAQYPLGFGPWLQALSYALLQPREIAIVGDLEAADTRALLGIVRNAHQPFQVVALGTPSAQSLAVSLLRDRGLVDGQPAAYVCRSPACQAPDTEPEVPQSLLENGQENTVTPLSVWGCPQARGSLISSQAPSSTLYG